jgi:hypothetical protein
VQADLVDQLPKDGHAAVGVDMNLHATQPEFAGALAE